MKASEYAAALTELVEAHGDLEVVDAWGSSFDTPEYADGDEDDEPVFVLDIG